jgi:8-oxo-dGTP pyrophosphatase MutT (NUDIX family)
MKALEELRLGTDPELPEGSWKLAAVAIVLGPDGDVLFIRRAHREGDPWSGDMAFPGGRHEPTDPDLRHTAMRETFEEVGLDLPAHGARCLGALPSLRSPLRSVRAPMAVSPWVFTVPRWPERFTLSEEVAQVHRFALKRLLAREGRGTFPWSGHGTTLELPRLDLDGQRVWGLTLRMLDDLLARLPAAAVSGDAG